VSVIIDDPAHIAVTPTAAPGTFPVPTGRGRWRLTLHRRGFAPNTYDQTQLLELGSARSRSLTRQWDAPAELRFTMNGRAPDCAAVQELQHEVYAWRWDDQTGSDVCVFRGIIDHAEDQITEQAHTVNFVAHDYLATIVRRFLMGGSPVNYSNVDQDQIAAALLAQAGGGPTPTAPYAPGSTIPIGVVLIGGDGASTRTISGQLRVRSYQGGTSTGTAIDQLAKVIGGFDYDVVPEPAATDSWSMIDGAGTIGSLGAGRDALRIFYPSQGIPRTDMLFLYGGNVAGVARTVNSGDYANTIRSLGNNGASDPNAAQLFSQQANADASGTTVGWWPLADTAPSDVNQQATLDQRAQGLLALDGVLVPSYSLTLRPGTYSWGSPNMGDTVPLLITSGRLQVNTTVRVVGLAWTIGDDGQEDVAVTVGRPDTSLGDLLARTNTAVNALARR
jgi:hypothetical protein